MKSTTTTNKLIYTGIGGIAGFGVGYGLKTVLPTTVVPYVPSDYGLNKLENIGPAIGSLISFIIGYKTTNRVTKHVCYGFGIGALLWTLYNVTQTAQARLKANQNRNIIMNRPRPVMVIPQPIRAVVTPRNGGSGKVVHGRVQSNLACDVNANMHSPPANYGQIIS